MRNWCRGLALLAVLLLLLGPSFQLAERTVEAADTIRVERWVETTTADFSQGTVQGLVAAAAGDGELRLLDAYRRGVYTSVQHEMSFPCQMAGLLYRGRVPEGATLSFSLRILDEAGQWSSWVNIPPGPWSDPDGRAAGEALVLFPTESAVLQYQVTFSRKTDVPALEEVVIVCMAAEDSTPLRAEPPWLAAKGWPGPVPADEWDPEPLTATEAVTVAPGPLPVEIIPATLLADGGAAVAATLQMTQWFQRQELGLEDIAYSFLVDSQGGVYRGRSIPEEGVLYIGVLGAHPHEAFSPTVEDALVALLDWWVHSASQGQRAYTLATPADPLLAERLQTRVAAGNLRRDGWFFPRGVTGTDVDEWILLANPDASAVRVTAELHRQDGRVSRRTVRLPREARASLFVDQVVAEDVFWAWVPAMGSVLAERAMYYGHDADDSTGIEGLSNVWYLPGGRQEAGFTTTLTLLNPGAEAVTATVTVFAPAGRVGEQDVVVLPGSVLEVPVGQIYTGTTPVGCQVAAAAPLAVEQQVLFAASQGGYGMPGSPQLSRRWIFAGVETEDPSVTVLSLLNPYEENLTVTLTLMSEDGTTLRRSHVVPPGEQTLAVNSILPQLALAAEVQAERPIAMARVTFFNDLRSAHASLGAVRPARHWFLPEGSTAEPFETLLVVANPNPVPTQLTITLLGMQGELTKLQFSMPSRARLTVPVNQYLPDLAGVSAVVEAEWPVVVERTMYLHDRQGGHACLGIAR